MSEKKELTVNAKELAKDKAVKIVAPVPEVEVLDKPLKEVKPNAPKEVFESGVGVGFVTGTFTDGVSVGIAGEDDERYIEKDVLG